MNVLGLMGSPRKGGNTDILVNAILEAARHNGHRTNSVRLHRHAIGPCVDCRGCKKEPHLCIVDDGMQELYPMIDAADVLVFGTPVYWCGPTGIMKQFFDRLRPYFSNGKMKGKKAILVAPAGDGPDEADLLIEMFRRSFGYLDMEMVGQVLGRGYDRGDILKDEAAMSKAAELGKRL